MFRFGLEPTASLLCSLEKVGYGRLDLDSDLGGESSLSMPGMEDLLLGSTGDIEVREEVLSLVVDLRWDLCLSFLSDRSCLDDSFFSLLLSGLVSRILEGMMRDHWHGAAHMRLPERLF